MANDNKITRETVIGTSEAASISGLTIRRIQQLIQDGTIPTIEKGKITLGDLYESLIRQSKKELSDEDRKIEQAKRKAEATLKASKAQMAKLEADELAGKMHRKEDVEKIMADMVYTIRDALMALPGRLAVDAANASSAAEASDVIRKEVHKIMNELADYEYDPEKFEERVRERMEWSASDDDDD